MSGSGAVGIQRTIARGTEPMASKEFLRCCPEAWLAIRTIHTGIVDILHCASPGRCRSARWPSPGVVDR